MSSCTETKLQALRSAIIDAKPPYCCGTLPVRVEDLSLYYGKEDESCRRINFSTANVGALEHLSDTCDKATFGRNQEDVFDETYRKAGKLDTAYFATKLDVERSGLMSAVRYDLLEGHDGHRPIKVELYKLNVYGKDSFFKSHKDTPRSTTMFGSLVVVLPSPHEGGVLIFRHGGQEWRVDFAKALSGSSKPHLHIAYATFFSDVEHAVTPVKSGYRVTLTYNLYFDEDAAFPNAQLLKSIPVNKTLVRNALWALLNDNMFLPQGGYLGFGLRHEYPVEIKPKDTNTLEFLSRSLKGSDAMILQACKDFDLETSLQISYDGDDYCRDEMLITREPDINGRYLFDDEPLKRHLVTSFDAKVIKQCYDCRIVEEKVDFEVHWVTERTQFNALEAVFATYGNEPGVEHIYGLFCLIARIGPVGARAFQLNPS